MDQPLPETDLRPATLEARRVGAEPAQPSSSPLLRGLAGTEEEQRGCNGDRLPPAESQGPRENKPAAGVGTTMAAEESAGDHQQQQQQQQLATVYYGVNVPPDAVLDPTEQTGPNTVYTDKTEALRAVKKLKGARFKAFGNREAALAFAAGNPQSPARLPRNGPTAKDPDMHAGGDATMGADEKPSLFRAPKPQDLVKLRKAFEKGDADYIAQTVWSNPRYLISSGDTPTLLQEGSRYNALHVAARADKPELVRLVLEIIEDPSFMELLYNDDSETSRAQRMNFLIDLYLNTPDKPMSETPLHFAAKFGSAKTVDILTSHPACELNSKNKFGETPMQIVCSRCPGATEALKREIESYFQGRFFILILRTEDNSSLPIVPEPWSPQVKRPLPAVVVSKESVLEPLSVKAYAGPMSPVQAEQFHKQLKSSPVFSPSPKGRVFDFDVRDVRLSDHEKGLERIGRQLASQMEVSWREYWPFLNTYCDLSKPEGLEMLESHLRSKFDKLKDTGGSDQRSSSDSFASVCSNADDLQDTSLLSSGLLSLCKALENFHLDSSLSSDVSGEHLPDFAATADFARQDRSDASSGDKHHETIGVVQHFERTCELTASHIFWDLVKLTEKYQKNYRSLKSLQGKLVASLSQSMACLFSIFCNVQKCGESIGAETQRLVHFRMAASVHRSIVDENELVREFLLKVLADIPQTIEFDLSDEEPEEPFANVKNARKERVQSPANAARGQHVRCFLDRLHALLKEAPSPATHCGCCWSNPSRDGDVTTPKMGVCISAAASPEMSTSSEEFVTPPMSPDASRHSSGDGPFIFIAGSLPSKTDVDMLRVVENIAYDPLRFPFIHRWKKFIQSMQRENAKGWPSPFAVPSPSSKSQSRFPGYESRAQPASPLASVNSFEQLLRPSKHRALRNVSKKLDWD